MKQFPKSEDCEKDERQLEPLKTSKDLTKQSESRMNYSTMKKNRAIQDYLKELTPTEANQCGKQ